MTCNTDCLKCTVHFDNYMIIWVCKQFYFLNQAKLEDPMTTWD